MFKNITAYRINDLNTKQILHNEAIDFLVEDNPSEPPAATLWRRFGFARPTCFGKLDVFRTGRATLFYIQQQERLLPGTVIRRALMAKRLEIEKRDNRTLNRKEIAQQKDQIVIELLPKAFIKASGTFVMVIGDWLLIDSGSAKVCEEIIAFLVQVFEKEGALSLRLLSGREPDEWMRKVAVERENKHFTALDAATLKGKSRAGGVLRLKDIDLDSDEALKALTSNKRVVEMALGWKKDATSDINDMHFTLTNQLVFKRLKFADIVVSQAKTDSEEGGEVAYFDATVAITAPMLLALVEAVEKEVKAPAIDEDDEL